MTPRANRHRHPIPSTLNVAIVIVQLLAVCICIYFVQHVQSWVQLVLLALAFGIVMNSVYAIIHEAEHGILFRNRLANEGVGVFMSLLFPAPFHLLRMGHIGHHQRNRSDDEAFDFYFEGEHPIWKCMQLYGTMTGMFWVVIVLSNVVLLVVPRIMSPGYWKFDRPSTAFMRAFNPAYWWLIRAEAAAAIVLHTAIIWGFSIPIVNYAIMYFGFGFTWSAMQYVHHYGTERHVLKGARNLWIFRPLDLVWLNHNWHLTHHKKPTVPWIHLPEIGKREDPKRGFLLWHYLRMWKGPRRGTEHVENRFTGRIVK